MKRAFLSIGCLVLFALIVILPPLINGYVYPNIGHDTAAHLEILDKIKIGSIPAWNDPEIRGVRYYADYIIGYPMDAVNQVTHVSKDTLFFWFNYLALIGVGFTLFFVLSKLVSLTTGLLALIIPIFSSFGFLAFFYSGVIFNIINMGIILPLIIYFLIQSFKRKRNLIGVILLSILFMFFHSTGIYLPFFALAGLGTYLIAKRKVTKKFVLISLGTVVATVTLLAVFNPIAIEEILGLERQGMFGFPLLLKSLMFYMSPALLVALILVVVYLSRNYKSITNQEKLVALGFLLCAAVMIPAMLGLSPMPFVQGIDFAILLSIAATVLIGILIGIDKERMVSILVIILAVAGSIVNLTSMYRYNSAVEKIDLKAIEYVNSLPIQTYSSSNNIDHTVYSRFLHKTYVPTDGDVIISRNVSMKSNGVLPEEDPLMNPDREKVVTFVQNGIWITVYK